MSSRANDASLAAFTRALCARSRVKLIAGQNLASWAVVRAIVDAYDGADYDDLVAAVSQHDHPAGGHAFIDYCIRNGWLKRD